VEYIDIYRPARLDPPVPIEETLGALDVKLAPGEIAAIEAAIPAEAVAGARYDNHQMSVLDSEK